jgi:hypothetical protein
MKSNERYEIRDWLGKGGMGVVRRAYDRERGEEVAVKSLHATDAETLYRFKREFRSIADVVHRNLVVLHEFKEVDGVWAITMEFVRGVDFLEHVRPGGPSLSAQTTGSAVISTQPTTGPAATRAVDTAESGPASEGPRRGALDEARLRAALKQLAEGIQALHAAGRLHCDIKPKNVLVTPDGRVVVVDFGLVTELVPDPLARWRQREIAGTVPYMAPEQARPAPLTAAADWYGFGALLYEALTGRLPFEGDVGAVLEQKRRGPPAPPRSIAPEAPEDLSELCVELLRASPAERPEAPDIFAWLGVVAAPPPSIRSRFVGREAEIRALGAMFEAALSGRAVTTIVHGASGIGKTTLVRRFLERLAARAPVLIFEGRCYEHESVPYKALDGIVDQVSQFLVDLPAATAEALLPDDAPVLGLAFPVLKRVSGIARSLAVGPDQQQLRRRVFAALRELLRRIGSSTPLVLLIDDLQWGDADSAALLVDLFSPPSPPPLLLLACCRTHDLTAAPALEPLLARWARPAPGHDVHRLELGALDPDETRELAGALLGRSAAALPELVDAIAREAEGSPLFAQELSRHAIVSASSGEPPSPALLLEDVVREHVGMLGAEERRLLEIVAIAGHPVHEDAARAAVAAPLERRALALLQALHLVSRRGVGGTIEPYHDRVRVAVLGGIPPEDERAHHLALAHALEALPEADPEILAQHYRSGGAPDLAARHAVLAAERASAALAFSRAASLYRAALDAGVPAGERWRLRSRLAEALANAGKGREAAESFDAAAGELDAWSPGDPAALDLRRRAAEHYLRSGHMDEGLTRLREVLAATGTGYPTTPAGALLSLVQQRARLRLRGLAFRLVEPHEVRAEDRIRVEACWSASLGLSMVDSIRAAYFQVRHERAALALGEPVNVARGLASHVAVLASEGGAANRRRCGEILDAAQELARAIDDPAILMLTHFCAGTAAYFGGQWRRAVERSGAAQAIGRERCVGVTWEMNSAGLLELWALAYLGELPALSRRLPRLLAEARDRDDVFAETGLRLGLPGMVALARDRPEDADLDAAAAMRRWTSSGFHSQHYWALVGRAQTALYRGDGAAALGLLEASWPDLERAHLLRLQNVRVELRHLRARAALAAAGAREPRDRRRLLRLAEREASHLAGEDMPWAAPLAALVGAGVSALRGAPEDAADALGLAARGFDALEMALYAAAARLQRGRLAGGGEGVDARAWMEERGIESPARMARMLVPGFEGVRHEM